MWARVYLWVGGWEDGNEEGERGGAGGPDHLFPISFMSHSFGFVLRPAYTLLLVSLQVPLHQAQHVPAAARDRRVRGAAEVGWSRHGPSRPSIAPSIHLLSCMRSNYAGDLFGPLPLFVPLLSIAACSFV